MGSPHTFFFEFKDQSYLFFVLFFIVFKNVNCTFIKLINNNKRERELSGRDLEPNRARFFFFRFKEL